MEIQKLNKILAICAIILCLIGLTMVFNSLVLEEACEIQSTRTTILVEKTYGLHNGQCIEGSGEVLNLGYHHKAEDINIGDVVEVSYDYTWKDMKVTDIEILNRKSE
jgi:hypothetical protein